MPRRRLPPSGRCRSTSGAAGTALELLDEAEKIARQTEEEAAKVVRDAEPTTGLPRDGGFNSGG